MGYLVVSANGDVFAFGSEELANAKPAVRVNGPVVGVAATPDGGGYWLANASGAVYAFGDARYYGAWPARPRHQRVVGIAATATGHGYWLATVTGQVLAFGDARRLRPAGHPRVAGRVSAIASTSGGLGYWLATASGQVLAFGHARAWGEPSGLKGSVVVGMAATPGGRGYWLAERDGRALSFGNAPRFSPRPYASPVVGIAPTQDGKGYWLATANGGVLPFGDARALGSVVSLHLRSPLAGIAAFASRAQAGPQGLRITTLALPAGRVGQHYRARLVATGGTPPYRWLIEHGSLPGGLALDATSGAITGVPLAAAIAELTVAVSDRRGARASTILTLATGPAPGPVARGRGALAITVDQLPAGLVGSVLVRGPDGYSAHLSSTTVLKVAPGTYAVRAQPVGDGTSTYYPTVTGSPAQVVAGHEAVVGVSYLVTIPQTTKVLGPADLADLTSASPNGSDLSFSWSGEEPPDLAAIQQGDVLNAPASAQLPLGLFVKVTSLATANGALYLTAKPATLTEAVTRGELNVNGRTEQLTAAQVRALGGKVQLAYQGAYQGVHQGVHQGGPSTTCGLDLNGQLNLANPTFTVTPHMDASWSPGGGFQADAYLTVVESVQYSFKFSAGLDCTVTWKLVPPFNLLGTVGIPIDLGIVDINISPVFEVDLTAKAEVNAQASAAGQQGFTLQVGASYANGQLSPIHSYTPQNCFASTCPGGKAPSWSGGGYLKLSIGPKVTFNIGVVPWEPMPPSPLPMPLIGPYVGIDGFAKLALSTSQPVWQLGFGLEAAVGFQASISLGSFSLGLNAQLTIPIVTVTVAASPPVLSTPAPGPEGLYVLPSLETGTLLQDYVVKLQAQGYTGTGSPGFNAPSGPVSFALADSSTQWYPQVTCADNYPQDLVSLTNTTSASSGASAVTSSATLTLSTPGLPLNFSGQDLEIGITLTDVLKNLTPVCLVIPLVPGVHPESYPLKDAEAGVNYSYQLPITPSNQGGTYPYTCPSGGGPGGSYGLIYYAGPVTQVVTELYVAPGQLPAPPAASTACTVEGYFPPSSPASYFTSPHDFAMPVSDTQTTSTDSLELPPLHPALELSIPATTVPAEEGVPFSFAPQAEGGEPPYTWSASSACPGPTAPGSKPSWLSIDPTTGALSGTPPPGSSNLYNVPVSLTDALGGGTGNPFVACEDLGVYVAPPLSLTGAAMPDAEVGAAYSYTPTVSGGSGTTDFALLGLAPGAVPPAGSYDELPPGLSFDPATGSVSGIPLPGSQGSYTFQEVATDAFGVQSTATFSVTVVPPVQVTSPDLLPPSSTSPVAPVYYAQLTASGGVPGYTWSIVRGALPCGLKLYPDGSILGYPGIPPGGAGSCPPKVYTSSALVEVTDALGGTATLAVTVPVGVAIMTQGPLPEAEQGVPYGLHQVGSPPQPVALLAQGGSPPYSWAARATFVQGANGAWQQVGKPGSLPPGLRLAALPSPCHLASSPCSLEAIEGTPLAAGSYIVAVDVQDASGGPAWVTNFRLVVAPPLRSVPQPPTADAGVPYSYVLQAVGGVGPYRWAPGHLPAGLSLASDGSLTGSIASIGTQGPFKVLVTDNQGAHLVASLSVSVVARPTVTTSSPLPTARPGTAYSVALAATGGTPRDLSVNNLGTCTVTVGSPTTCTAGSSTTPPYLWSLAPSDQLPPGLGFDPATGTISGVPALAGQGTTTILHVTATDYWGAHASAKLALTVARPLVLATTTLPPAEDGLAYTATLVAKGGSGGYTWSLRSGSWPAGLSLDASTGVISGVPAQAGGGANPLELCVSDSAGAKACAEVTGLSVAPALSVATGHLLPEAGPGTPYSVSLLASGGVLPYAWSVPATTNGYPMPAWLALSAQGMLTGTPPASAAGHSYTFPAQVTDNLGASVPAQFTLMVGQLPPAGTTPPGTTTTTTTAATTSTTSATTTTTAATTSTTSATTTTAPPATTTTAPPAGPTLRAVSSVLANGDALAVGDGGTVLQYNGSSWQSEASGTTSALYGVAYDGTGSSAAWAVGAGGTIVATTDNGSSWSAQASGTTNNLYAVACPAASTCWAVGAGGTIVSTADGGSTPWVAQSSGTTADLYAVSCSSSSDCWAVGAGGTIVATTDGAHWSAQPSGTAQALYGISCPSGTLGCWAVGAAGTIVSTYGGHGWAPEVSGTTANLYAVDVGGYCGVAPFSDCAYAVGSGGTTVYYGTSGWVTASPATSEDLYGLSYLGPYFTSYAAVGAAGTEVTQVPLGA